MLRFGHRFFSSKRWCHSSGGCTQQGEASESCEENKPRQKTPNENQKNKPRPKSTAQTTPKKTQRTNQPQKSPKAKRKPSQKRPETKTSLHKLRSPWAATSGTFAPVSRQATQHWRITWHQPKESPSSKKTNTRQRCSGDRPEYDKKGRPRKCGAEGLNSLPPTRGGTGRESSRHNLRTSSCCKRNHHDQRVMYRDLVRHRAAEKEEMKRRRQEKRVSKVSLLHQGTAVCYNPTLPWARPEAQFRKGNLRRLHQMSTVMHGQDQSRHIDQSFKI